MSARWVMVVVGALVLAGCFSGDSGKERDRAPSVSAARFDGGVEPASVSSNEQAADLAFAAVEGTFQAVQTKALAVPSRALVRSVDADDPLTAELLRMVEGNDRLALLPTVAASLMDGDCGGEVDVEIDHDRAGRPDNGSVEFTYRYSDYCIATDQGRVITDGRGDYTATYKDAALTRYSIAWNLTRRRDDGDPLSVSLGGKTTCEFSDSPIRCRYSEDFTGSDGEPYRISDVVVSRNGNGNFSVSGRVHDGDLGFVDLSASGVDLRNCDRGGLAGGSITLQTESGEPLAGVSFPNCSEFVVTFGGNAETYPQPDWD